MRHRKKLRRLNRTSSHRRALLRNLARSFFIYEKIRSTEAKCKEARKVIEKLITLAKRGPDDLHARRQLMAYIPDRDIVKKLIEEIAPRYQERNGGYTRLIKLGARFNENGHGDAAQMAMIELV